eukprot:1376869-Pleurochrysis_carterae.AAC.1
MAQRTSMYTTLALQQTSPTGARWNKAHAAPRACRKHPLCLDNDSTGYRLPHVDALTLYASTTR